MLIFDGLSLDFFVKFENGMPEFINGHFFLSGKLQINDFRDFKFHHLIVLGIDFEFTRLQAVFEGIKRDARIWLKLRTVKDFIGLSFDDENIISLIELKVVHLKLLGGGHFEKSSLHRIVKFGYGGKLVIGSSRLTGFEFN